MTDTVCLTFILEKVNSINTFQFTVDAYYESINVWISNTLDSHGEYSIRLVCVY